MVAWLDVCRYNPTTGGTTDFTYASAVTGYQSPAAAGAVNAAVYRYRAESADLTQWEIGYGAYNTGTGVLSRTTVLFNSSATGTGAGQSGAGSKINFTLTPQVAIVALAEDLLVLGSGTFTQFEYTASSGQTTFSGTDINGATLFYSVGYLEVYLNGNRLNKADFTATDTTSVVLAALAGGDQVTMTAYTTATVANTLVPTNNLSDVTNAATARVNLGIEKSININSTDLNNLKTAGWFDGSLLTNSPDGTTGWFYIEVTMHSGFVVTTNEYLLQRASTLTSSGGLGLTYVRWEIAGVWTPWQAILTAGPQTLSNAQQIQVRSNLNIQTSFAPQGRLTLQSFTPVMTAAQTGKNTLYYTGYVGVQIPIYDANGVYIPTTITGGEISALTTDTTKSPAAIGANKVNDWFVWNDAGTIRLSHGPDWTSDTVRSAGSTIGMNTGILQNIVAITNGPGANRGTYVGTTRSNASSLLDFHPGGSGSGGVEALIGIWNAYNRVNFSAAVFDSAGSYTYAVATFRSARASNTNRISMVRGIDEDAVFVGHNQTPSNAAGGQSTISIGLDSTTSTSGPTVTSNVSGSAVSLALSWSLTPGLGYHFLQALERSDTGTTTYFPALNEVLTAMGRY